MVSDYREPYGLHSTRFLHSASIDSSSQALRSDSYTGQELERMQHQRLQMDQHELSSRPHPQFQHHPQPQPQFLGHRLPQHELQPHPLSSTQSYDLHEAILREIEKENIRQEIIMYEIMIRRRALEAEVRYEMMMEKAMALERRRSGFPSESPRPMGLDMSGFPSESPIPMGLDMPMRFPLAETRGEGKFLEERIILPPPPRNTLNNWCEGGGFEAVPFQRAPIDERMAIHSEVRPVLEASSERNNMILQAKPIRNITGAKRARSGSDSSEYQSDGILKKKKEWSCALCQVSVVNERDLNMHLAGENHKREEAALNAQKAGKSSRVLRSPNKVAKPPKGSETEDPVTNSEVKLTSESSTFGKKGDAISVEDGPPPLDGDLNSNLEKDNAVVKPQEVQNNDEAKKNDICQVGVKGTQEAMDKHEQGENHILQLTCGQSKDVYGISLLGPSNQKAKTEDQDGLNVQVTDGDNGMFMVDVAEIHHGKETSCPATVNEVKLTSESLPFGKNGDASSGTDGPPPLDGKLNSDNCKEIKAAVKPQEVQEKDEHKKKAHKFWCELCQIGVGSQKTMDMHEQGNKHKLRLKFGYSVSAVGPSIQKAKSEEHDGTNAKSIKGSETANPSTYNAVKLTSESLPFGKNGDASSVRDDPQPLDGKLISGSLKKDKAVAKPQEVLQNDEPNKTLDKSWCQICQVNMGGTQKSIDTHQQGKKHKRRLKCRDRRSYSWFRPLV